MAKNKYIGRQFTADNGDIHICVDGYCSRKCSFSSVKHFNTNCMKVFKTGACDEGVSQRLHMIFNPPYKTVFAPSGRYKKGYQGVDNCEICNTCHQSKYQHDWKNTHEGEKFFCPEHYTMVK